MFEIVAGSRPVGIGQETFDFVDALVEGLLTTSEVIKREGSSLVGVYEAATLGPQVAQLSPFLKKRSLSRSLRRSRSPLFQEVSRFGL
ncbi:MAG: hypothetical protein WAV54_15965 [Acidimicrobiales bacterium]